MEYLKYLLILVSVMSAECKTWFLASDIKKADEVFYPSRVNTQIPEVKTSNALKLPPTTQLEALNFNKTFNNSPGTELNYAHYFNPILRPKRKIIRRRCPERKQRYSKSHNDIKSRFLEVFEVVQFEHVKCVSSTGLEGTCLHEYDCQKINGTSMGSCADGYGICCISK